MRAKWQRTTVSYHTAIPIYVAALAEQGKSLILVADKQKIIPLSARWWIMFAGNDISPVFPIVDAARKTIANPSTIDNAVRAVFAAYIEERNTKAADRFIVPYGVSAAEFRADGLRTFGESLFKEIAYRCAAFRLGLQLIVAGFDADNKARIAMIDDDGSYRRDIPGFATIGSGYTGAQFMLAYRVFSPNMPLREALYCHCRESGLLVEEGEVPSGPSSWKNSSRRSARTS